MGIPTNNPSNENRPREGGIRGQIPRNQNPGNRNPNGDNLGQQGNQGQQRTRIPRNPEQGNPQSQRVPQQRPNPNSQGGQQQGQRNSPQGQQGTRIPQQRPQPQSQESGLGQRIPRQQPQIPRQPQNPSDGRTQPPVQPQRPTQPRIPVVNTFDDPNDQTFTDFSNDSSNNFNGFEEEFDEVDFPGFTEDTNNSSNQASELNDFGDVDFGDTQFGNNDFRDFSEPSQTRNSARQIHREEPPVNQQSYIEEPRQIIDPPVNVDETGQNSFLNAQKTQVEPFGGDNSKRKIKETQFDDRKNLRQKAVVVQAAILVLVTGLVGLGVKNAIFPPDSLSVDEVSAIAMNTVGLTNFPLEGGKGYVKDFMNAFLTVDTSNPESGKILSYFFNGNKEIDANDVTRFASARYGQSLISGPTIYEATALSDYSANYTVGAIVKPYTVGENDKRTYFDAKIEYFSVNVYYDKKTQQYSIPRDSPTIIPEIAFQSPNDLPKPATFGTGESDDATAQKIKPLVTEFMKAYAVSSPSDFSAIEQYIKSSDEVQLETGLNGKYEFANGDPDTAIEYIAFAQDPEKPSKEHKVQVKVKWEQVIGEGEAKESITYDSQYVMTIQKQSNDKFLVTKFAPFYFMRDDKAFAEYEKNNADKPAKEEKVVEEEVETTE